MHKKFIWYFAFLSPLVFIGIVFVLGIITPGYNHLTHSISNLALGKFHFIQAISFMLLGLGFISAAHLFSTFLKDPKSKSIWRNIFLFCGIFMFVETIFPTDKMDKLYVPNLSFSGLIHFGALAAFFILAPFGVYFLCKTQMHEESLAKHVYLTAICGFGACILCYIWTSLFIFADILWYMGLFQKVIGLICLFWYQKMLWLIRPLLLSSVH